MDDLIVGLGLVLVVEGLLWALFPNMATSLLEAAKATSESNLRMLGLVSACLGFLVVWFVRG